MKHELSISDVYDPDLIHKVIVEREPAGISITVPGYGSGGMEPGYGSIALLEMRNGVPHVIVWGDITKESHTVDVDLSGASERLRPPDIDD